MEGQTVEIKLRFQIFRLSLDGVSFCFTINEKLFEALLPSMALMRCSGYGIFGYKNLGIKTINGIRDIWGQN